MAELKGFLADHDLYVFTINGFPYGPFHGRPVKEQVYQPDWQRRGAGRLQRRARRSPRRAVAGRSGARGQHQHRARDVQAARRSARARSSTWRATWSGTPRTSSGIRERTGRTIALALEPEPYCFLETIDETVGFFERHLFGRRRSPPAERAHGSGARRRRGRAAAPPRRLLRRLPCRGRVRGPGGQPAGVAGGGHRRAQAAAERGAAHRRRRARDRRAAPARSTSRSICIR